VKLGIALVLAALLSLVLPAGAAHATKAYSGSYYSVAAGDPARRGIVGCIVDGAWTTVTTAGGSVVTVQRLRILSGRQNAASVVQARRFLQVRRAVDPGVRSANLVVACALRVVDGVPRMVVRLKSGARWALVRPRISEYAATMG
jgi:hypothetical protein